MGTLHPIRVWLRFSAPCWGTLTHGHPAGPQSSCLCSGFLIQPMQSCFCSVLFLGCQANQRWVRRWDLAPTLLPYPHCEGGKHPGEGPLAQSTRPQQGGGGPSHTPRGTRAWASTSSCSVQAASPPPSPAV